MSGLSDLNGSYTIDPVHSELAFVTRHAMVTKVRGTFSEQRARLRDPTRDGH